MGDWLVVVHNRRQTFPKVGNGLSVVGRYRGVRHHHLLVSTRVAGLCCSVRDGVCEWCKLVVGDQCAHDGNV